MKKTKFIICITLFSVAITFSQTTITNNPNTRYQAMKGWGTSVAWWGNIVGGMPQASIDEICYRIAVEANLNFFRFKIGGGDNPNCPAGDHLRKDGGQTPGYRPFYANNQGFGVVDVSKDYRQIAVMDKLASLRAPYGDMITEMFSCSPPYYMTNSFCTSGAVGAGENLAPGFEDDFADYLCSVTKTLRDTHPNWNIKDIAPFNEPYSNWWPAYGGQEGCKMLAPTQATVLWRTWQSQQTYGISDLGLVASDCNSIGEARQNAFDLWTNHRNEYNGISNIAVHSYFGTSQEKADLYTDIANTGKSIWQTETGPLSWFLPDGGQWWWRHYDIAQRLVDDIRNLKSEVWCIWQANGADDGWALVQQTNFNENDQYKTPTLKNTRSFYIMKQIASYIKVGYTQIANSDPNSMTFVSPDNKKVVVVISNYKTTPSAYSIDLSNFQPITYFDTYRTSGGDDSGENAKLLTSPIASQKGVLSGNRIAYTAPAMSVTTFVASLETPISVSVNDFETVAPNNVVRYGSDLSIVNNPLVNATNATSKVSKIGRTTANWYELFAFNIDPITVPSNTTYYLHTMVKYDTAADIAIRYDGINRDTDGVTPIRALNPYTASDAGKWKDLVFAIAGGTSGISLNAIQFHPDLGFENTPAVQVLNNSTSFGYIDELLISTSSTERIAVAAPTLASTLANFDGISPAVTTAFGATQAIVANPYPNGGNTSANAIRIGRTSQNWYELTKFNIPDFSLSAGETKYIHIAVNYPASPVTSIRIDVDNTSSPNGQIDIFPVNTYASTSNGHWQDLVFAVSGGAKGLAVNNLVLVADVGDYAAPPAGQVLNNTANYAYIDNIVVNSSSTPLFTARTSLQAITLYATLNTNPTPRLVDYSNAGVIGVTADNLTAVNTAIESASPEPTTFEQVQAVVNQVIALNIIIRYANSNANLVPTVENYTSAGVVGVTAANIMAVNIAIDTANPVPTTLASVQAVIVHEIPVLSFNLCKGSATPAIARGTTDLQLYASASATAVALADNFVLTSKIYYATLNGSARTAVTVTVINLPSEVIGSITSNTAGTTAGTFRSATLAVGPFVGTSTTVSYRVPAFVGANSYFWTVPAGVRIVGQAEGVRTVTQTGANGNVLNVNYSGIAAGIGSVGAITVQAQNANGCNGAAKSVTLTKALPLAPAAITMHDLSLPLPTSGIPTAVRSFAKYMGTNAVLRLTATPSVAATSYEWNLPAGVNQLSGGTSNVITVNFAGVTRSNTDNFTTTAGVSTNVLRIGVKAVNGVGVSTVSNSALVNPTTTSTARLLTLTAVAPAAPTLRMLDMAVSSTVAVTDISRYIGTNTPLTLVGTVAATTLASSFSWELAEGVNVVAGSVLSSNSIRVNFEDVEPGTASLYIGIKAVNGMGSSVRSNATATPATSSTATLLKLSAGLPSAAGAVVGSLAICSNRASSVTYTITAAAGKANSYRITAPVGTTIVGGTGNTITINAVAGAAFTVNYPNGFTSVRPTQRSISIQSINGFGVSATNKVLTLTSNACTTSSRTAKVAPIAQEFKVIAYPNPSSGVFNLAIESSNASATTIQVYDMQGKMIENMQVNTNAVEIGANYTSGIYNVILENAGQAKTIRLIKK